ncbi:hypothetical protein ACFE04_000759 [Oxalis oulophora]
MVAKERIKPDQVTIGSVLCGCSHLGSRLPLVGKSVHGYMVKNGLELNVEIGTPLVDMYVKCGSFKNACQVFDLMPAKNIKTWTVLICGLAKTGYTHEALALFEVMRKSGVRPNEITFTGILSGCADAGLVCEGLKHFKMIKDEYGLEPRVQHYGCMVELFGKAGLLKKAYEIITSMRVEPNVIIWTSFLSACKDHKQFEMAERVVERALKSLRPEKDGLVYTLISELYILNGKWEDAKRAVESFQHMRLSSEQEVTMPSIKSKGALLKCFNDSFSLLCLVEMNSLAFSVGTCSPRNVVTPSTTARSSEISATKFSSLPQKSQSSRKTQLKRDNPNLFKRREAIGFGFSVGLLEVLLKPQTSAAAEEKASCELTVSPSGLAFCDKAVGYGPEAVKGQLIKAHYVGKLENGKVFDSSYNRGKPLTFRVGVGEVIKGWDQGIIGGDGIPPMLAGGKRSLKIPPELAYGTRGAGCRGGSCIIPPDSVLVFDVEFIGKAS